eukprot:COSAG06_NODE_1811_length_8317_cov_7.969944_7_plen_317_part_00
MPAATRRVVLDATNLLTATPTEAVLIIACALTDPRDLLHLAVAVPPRFFIKCIAAPPPPHRTSTSSGGAAAAEATEMWSIIQEAARRCIGTCTDQEQGWVPRRGRESWLGLMWEVESLRRSAVFGRLHSMITLSAGGSLATKGTSAAGNPYLDGTRSAASKAVMRAGRHYARFTFQGDVAQSDLFVGVIRPGWDVEGGKSAYNCNCNCFYYTANGHRYPDGRAWEGVQIAMKGDRIGMLLDLDQGSMTVYKNDELLGVMATGLSGEYSWAVALYGQHIGICIEAAAAPASPTVEEVQQAEAWTAPVASSESDEGDY